MATASVTGLAQSQTITFGDDPAGSGSLISYTAVSLTPGGPGPEFCAAGTYIVLPQDILATLGGLPAGTAVTITLSV